MVQVRLRLWVRGGQPTNETTWRACNVPVGLSETDSFREPQSDRMPKAAEAAPLSGWLHSSVFSTLFASTYVEGSRVLGGGGRVARAAARATDLG